MSTNRRGLLIGYALCVISVIFNTGSTSSWKLEQTYRDMVCMNKLLTADVCFPLNQDGTYPKGDDWKSVVISNSPLPIAFADPWGHEYVYRYPAVFNTNDPDATGRSFDLYSLGRDGVSLTGGNDVDDIRNWDLNNTAMWNAYGVRTEEQVKRETVLIWCMVAGTFGVAAGCLVIMRKGFVWGKRDTDK